MATKPAIKFEKTVLPMKLKGELVTSLLRKVGRNMSLAQLHEITEMCPDIRVSDFIKICECKARIVGSNHDGFEFHEVEN